MTTFTTRVALVTGNAVTTIIQDKWTKKDLKGLAEICPGLTMAEVESIAMGSAFLDGDSSTGFTVKPLD